MHACKIMVFLMQTKELIQNIGDIKILGSIIKFCINIKTLYNSPKTRRQLKQNSRTYYLPPNVTSLTTRGIY